MAKYMTQKMSSGTLPAITYYRVQTVPHPSHEESEAFTFAAVTHYAMTHDIAPAEVERGTYRSNQGIPTAGITQEI